MADARAVAATDSGNEMSGVSSESDQENYSESESDGEHMHLGCADSDEDLPGGFLNLPMGDELRAIGR